MPIPVSCKCGKKFAAPDQLAGKRVKCPACSEPLQIPAGGGGDEPKPKALKVACSCGKTLMVKAELAGKAVKCPNCGNPVRIGGAQKPATTAPAKPASGSPPPKGNAIGDILDEVDLGVSATGHRCPECRNDLQPGDVICVKCGYNLESGKMLGTRTSRKIDPLKSDPPSEKAKKTRKATSSRNAGQVKAPAIALLIVGILNVLSGLYQIANNLFFMLSSQPTVRQAQADGQDFDAEQLEMIVSVMQGFGALGVAMAVVALIVAAFIILGALNMLNLKAYASAKRAAILAMIPCISPCCLIGLPIGIWAWVVLGQSETSFGS